MAANFAAVAGAAAGEIDRVCAQHCFGYFESCLFSVYCSVDLAAEMQRGVLALLAHSGRKMDYRSYIFLYSLMIFLVKATLYPATLEVLEEEWDTLHLQFSL